MTVDAKPLVLVTWNDAQASATKEYSKARDHKPAVMTTVGYLLDRDDVGVSICCERFFEDDEWAYRGHTFIPAGMVVSVDVLIP